MLLYNRNQYNIVKQLYSNKNKSIFFQKNFLSLFGTQKALFHRIHSRAFPGSTVVKWLIYSEYMNST